MTDDSALESADLSQPNVPNVAVSAAHLEQSRTATYCGECGCLIWLVGAGLTSPRKRLFRVALVQ